MSAKGVLVTLVVVLGLAAGAARSVSVADRDRSADREGPDGCGDPRPISGTRHAGQEGSLAELCRERAARLPQLLDQPCQIVTRPPFLLAGDLSEAELQTRFETAILPVSEALRDSYFRQLPQRPVLILMFTTEAAYREAAEQLFFDRGVSRFGYYKPGRQAILVNLAEGDGALAHELTHVLMDADFPNAPLWLQEGLATLHEAVEVGGEELDAGVALVASPRTPGSAVARRPGPRLTPVCNWRGAVLRLARDENRLPSVQQLIRTASFHRPDEALDYAHARYFCWFLHQRDVLSRYYATLRDRVETDPTGERTLREVLAARDWASVDLEFRIWLDDLDREAGREPGP
ncbi:MAG: hypothetical protein MUF25_00315 [Pirellulaceae bacterium]|nr:hypothetical protein [Pirellulaceae bacterium]